MSDLAITGVPDGVRVPFLYFGVDNSKASYFQASERVLLIGQRLPDGTAPAGAPVQIFGNEDALFGAGSMLADMARIVRLKSGFAEMWALPLDDAAAGVAGTWTVTVDVDASALTVAGSVGIHIGGFRCAAAVLPGDEPQDIAQALADAINADSHAKVLAAADDGVITLTANHKGLTAGQIDVRVTYNGVGAPVAGVTLTVAQTQMGTENPALSAALATLADEPYKWVALPYTDALSLTTMRRFFDDQNGRWAAMRMIYGHAFSARTTDSPALLVQFGGTVNDQHLSVLGIYGTPSAPWEVAAALAAYGLVHLSDAPELSRPEQTLELPGIFAPEVPDRFDRTVRQTLYYRGIGGYTVTQEGAVRLDRLLTTYQVNGLGIADTSFLDVTTLAQLMYFIEYVNNGIATAFPRVSLKDDGNPVFPGQFAVTPGRIRTYVIGLADHLANANVIENVDRFADLLVVARDSTDPNCVNMILPPDFVNQWRIGKILVQFYNQYPATT
ncbi:phage tail sheath subtilisin-like domain-containing protein [Paraburkholderia tuberum]|uniref:Mu-like prophage tail sheath protein gpL n=1 Tax=Paraburkholderia tuberum TaxID=157910 RepID=A0A1H1JTR7_9BURK|nr:phage tail sheath subtilisin-like domain-containing protein [Paraburkholderia tuberum]SDR52907.1 Mu-like prophage tail sheath protein gpL [Paraburkholderia tuberum]